MKLIQSRISSLELNRKVIKRFMSQGLTLMEASRKLNVASKIFSTWIDQQ